MNDKRQVEAAKLISEMTGQFVMWSPPRIDAVTGKPAPGYYCIGAGIDGSACAYTALIRARRYVKLRGNTDGGRYIKQILNGKEENDDE